MLAGAGGYNTAEVIELARELESMHAAGILSVTPYYNKPTQEGLYQHYKAIARPSRFQSSFTACRAAPASTSSPPRCRRLAEIENIVGVKEASGNIGQIASVIAQAPENFAVLSGDDAIALPVIALGGRGVISVASNEIPAEMTRLVHACLENDFARARELQKQYLPLMEINFIESNPGPAKSAMAAMGLLEPVWRLPLVAPKAGKYPENPRRSSKPLGLLGRVHAARAN